MATLGFVFTFHLAPETRRSAWRYIRHHLDEIYNVLPKDGPLPMAPSRTSRVPALALLRPRVHRWPSLLSVASDMITIDILPHLQEWKSLASR